MGSEGYLINQFLVRHSNKYVPTTAHPYLLGLSPRTYTLTNHRRTDAWGGEYANRMRFPVEVVKAVRQAVGEDFIIVFRLSMLDLVPAVRCWGPGVYMVQACDSRVF